MMQKHPVTGPILPERLREIASWPWGKAREVICKFDPMWGREPGEKIEWILTYTATVTGYASVRAASEEEAKKLAASIYTKSEIDWEHGRFAHSDIELYEIEAQP